MQEIFVSNQTVQQLKEHRLAAEFFKIYEIGRTLHVRTGEMVLLEHPTLRFSAEATVLFVKEDKAENTQLIVFQSEE